MSDGLTLYEITEELRRFTDKLVENGGVVSDEMEEEFHDLLEMEEEKTEGYIKIIQEFKRNAEALKEEEDRLKKRRKSYERSVNQLKERLLHAMRIRDEDVRETEIGKVRRMEASRRGLRVVKDVEELPEHFVNVSARPDKTAIREALEEGDEEAKEIAELKEATEYVRIY